MKTLRRICFDHLKMLCDTICDRSVSSDGNRRATSYFAENLKSYRWDVEIQEFEAMDWVDGGACLRCAGEVFQVNVSPYSLGCDAEGPLVSISSIAELEEENITGKLLIMHGEIATEQLMPKSFVFYNPEDHQHIISLLEIKKPMVIICATGRNASMAGGVYPFPLIEDGDFDIPSVYMTEEEGQRLIPYLGLTASLKSISERVPGKGCNVIARKGHLSRGRLIVTAHIDAKKGTPGAIDNATGVVTLLLLAERLKGYDGPNLVELVALNGEDYYAVPGQMRYIRDFQGRFTEILLNINIDGAGYKEGRSAFSFYGLPVEVEQRLMGIISQFDGLTVGQPWVQSDHSMFIQNGCPAVAISSEWFTDHIDSQQITHTPQDSMEIVDPAKLVEISQALDLFIRGL
ncbi:MAG: Zn-dependent exopeptidase M28 [Anaerolineales bacterium]|nr:MAG: Zn-dependent exopeptidase M28 [Anaerolineales bacterium]